MRVCGALGVSWCQTPVLCEDAHVPDWLDFDQIAEWVSGAWWSYLVIFGVAVVDAFFPLVPSETTLVIGGTFAATGDLNLLLVILAGAAGAIVGDNISFFIGHFVGEKTVKRWFSSEKSHKRLEWAEHTLDERGTYIIILGRFIPGGRTAVTFSAGYLPTFPWRRFIVYDVVAGLIWGDVRRAARLLRRQDVRGEPPVGSSPRTRNCVVAGVRRRARQALPAAQSGNSLARVPGRADP